MPGLISFFRCTFLVLIGSSVIWQLNAAEFAAAVADDIVLANLKPVISRSHHERQLVRVINLGHQRVARQASTARQQHTAGETGQLENHAVQLTYRQPRYDDQAVGRFYSNDPVGFTVSNPMSFNRYLYVNNNPYKYKDPDGQFLDTILDVGFILYDLGDIAINGVNDTNSASLAANVAGALIPGATGLGLVARAGNASKRSCCFVAGTQVLTESGYKSIEDVKLGERLWAKNTENGDQDWKPITKIFIEPNPALAG